MIVSECQQSLRHWPIALSPSFPLSAPTVVDLTETKLLALLNAERPMAPARTLPVLQELMLIGVATRVAASSSFPMAELNRLRGACSLMRDRVCDAPPVLCSINLMWVLQQ